MLTTGVSALQVWSLVRRFDQPEKYKRFIQSCSVQGGLNVGSVRQVHVVSGLPATRSTERLEVLDEDQHVFSYRVIDGDHRLKVRNSSSNRVHQHCEAPATQWSHTSMCCMVVVTLLGSLLSRLACYVSCSVPHTQLQCPLLGLFMQLRTVWCSGM